MVVVVAQVGGEINPADRAAHVDKAPMPEMESRVWFSTYGRHTSFATSALSTTRKYGLNTCIVTA